VPDQPPIEATTAGIRVEAVARRAHAPASELRPSLPDADVTLYAYRIRITNLGDRPAQLLSRHWVIIDADHNRKDVRGPGVVGQKPRLLPGEEFVYESQCPLDTEWGTMEGSYTFVRDDGERFEVAIPRFFLAPERQTV
jgi:ApaG protein